MLRTVLILAFLTLASPPTLAQSAFSAAAFVNDTMITQYDVDQRERLLRVTDAPQEGDLRQRALQSLIDERLKREAGREAGISPDEAMMNQALQNFARSLRLGPEQFEARLRSAGVSPAALREFLETDVIWAGVIRRRFGSRADVTEADVEAEIGAQGLTEKTTYNIGELSMPDAGNPGANMSRARSIVADIRAGASFQEQARTHSRSPSRDRGGVIGWVPEERLPPEVAGEVAKLEVGGVTDPIRVRGGIVILTLFDKQVEEVTVNGETREAVRRRLIGQQLQSYAEDYLEELRSAAYIETK